MANVHSFTRIKINASERTTLGDFCAQNQVDDIERDLITAALLEGGIYRGGGGAAPIWEIALDTD